MLNFNDTFCVFVPGSNFKMVLHWNAPNCAERRTSPLARRPERGACAGSSVGVRSQMVAVDSYRWFTMGHDFHVSCRNQAVVCTAPLMHDTTPTRIPHIDNMVVHVCMDHAQFVTADRRSPKHLKQLVFVFTCRINNAHACTPSHGYWEPLCHQHVSRLNRIMGEELAKRTNRTYRNTEIKCTLSTVP